MTVTMFKYNTIHIYESHMSENDVCIQSHVHSRILMWSKDSPARGSPSAEHSTAWEYCLLHILLADTVRSMVCRVSLARVPLE